MATTTIDLQVGVKQRLAKLKNDPRESFNSVLDRLLKKLDDASPSAHDPEGLAETIAIMSNPPLLGALARSVEDMRRGRVHAIDDV